MNIDKTGGPAFPFTCPPNPDGSVVTYTGATLRDYFAAQAITGCLPGSAFSTRELQIKAQWAYRMADAMLSERNKDA